MQTNEESVYYMQQVPVKIIKNDQFKYSRIIYTAFSLKCSCS